MNKNEAVLRINKYGKIGKIISIVMMVVIISSILTTTAAAIFLKVMPEDVLTLNVGTQAEVIINPSVVDSSIDDSTLNSMADAINNNMLQAGLNLGVIRLELNSATVEDKKVICKTDEGIGRISLKNVGNMLFFVVISLLLAAVSTFFGFKFCNAVSKCESPFEDSVINNMRYFAFSLLPWALYAEVPQYVVDYLFNNHVEFGFEFDMNVILAVLIILALTVVFKYGAILQKESDETL